MTNFSFEITAKDKNSKARAGIIKTAHGNIETPYLFPIATRGKLIALDDKDIELISPQALLANTYHLHFLPPGDKKIKENGGLHKIMSFNKPIFTDSGGFQALSLGIGLNVRLKKIGFFPGKNKIEVDKNTNPYAKITESGILFRSVYDESEELMDAKESMQIQSNLGSDVIMAFDQCNSPNETKEETKEVMERSHRWEIESLKFRDPKQAIYGIVHGGIYEDLRKYSAKFISSLDFNGIAIGGYFGKEKKELYDILDWVIPEIDSKKPVHLLGVGWIDDIFQCVERGIDTFDCVEMTRVARHGNIYIHKEDGGNINNKFRIKIKKAKYFDDNSKIDSLCSCYACKNYTKKDLHRLVKAKDPEYARLASIHNIVFMEDLLNQIRKSLKNGTFNQLKSHWLQ